MTLSLAKYVFSVAGGLAFGSFANVVIHRVPLGISVSAPPSACPGCGAAITWYDNVPLVSYAVLRARCRHCKEPIAWRYPAVEALTGSLWAAMLARIGVHPALPAFLALVSALVMLSFIDASTHRLPNAVLLPAFVTGAVVLVGAAAIGGQWDPLVHALIGAAAYGLPLLAIGLIAPSAIGGGDIKFAPYLGLYLGWVGLRYVALGAALGVFAGGIAGMALLATRLRHRRDPIAFGPFMAAGTLGAILFGAPLLRALTRS